MDSNLFQKREGEGEGGRQSEHVKGRWIWLIFVHIKKNQNLSLSKHISLLPVMRIIVDLYYPAPFIPKQHTNYKYNYHQVQPPRDTTWQLVNSAMQHRATVQELDFQITSLVKVKSFHWNPEGQLSASTCSHTKVSGGLLSIMSVVSVQQLRLHPLEGLLLLICGISSDSLPLGNTFDPFQRVRCT